MYRALYFGIAGAIVLRVLCLTIRAGGSCWRCNGPVLRGGVSLGRLHRAEQIGPGEAHLRCLAEHESQCGSSIAQISS